MVVQKNGDMKIKAENLIDEAYNKGYADALAARSPEEDVAYQRGLDDAWEAAKKIALAVEDGGLLNETAYVIFGMRFYQVFRDMSVTEVIEKIRKYEQDHAPGCDNCKHKDDQFSVCSGCEDASEYETKTTEANCGECHRRYYCEASPDSCIHAKMAQADDEIGVGDEVIYQRKSYDPHNGEKGVVIGISGDWREVRFLSNWSSVGVQKNSLIKTGRHFDQIQEVLKALDRTEE